MTDWNQRAGDMFGWSREEVLGRNFFEFLIPAETRASVEGLVAVLLRGKVPRGGTAETLTKSGKKMVCEWTNSVLYDREGRPAGVISLALDVNGRHAMPEGGRLILETRNAFPDEAYCRANIGLKPGAYVLLSVSDTGCGMEKAVRDRIFEPFFTTKGPGEGTGLGLSIVFGIVTNHGGHVACYSEPGAGTTFKIYLPALEREIPMPSSTTLQMPAFGTETLLLVDDEASIRELGKELLSAVGYEVMTAGTASQALKLYAEHRDRIALVILDLIMPEMGGYQCLDELLKIDSEVKVLIASGYSAGGPDGEVVRHAGAQGFIEKPYALKQILTSIRRVLDSDGGGVR